MPLLVAFASYQRWLGIHGRALLLDLTLFREQNFTVGLVTTLAFFAGMASFFLVLALYLQQGRGLSTLASGMIFTTLGLGYLVTLLCALRLTRRLGRQSLALGALGIAAGQILLRVTVANIGMAGNIVLLIPALLLNGAGEGLVIAPLVSMALAGLAPRHAGAAAGVQSMVQQVANALGVAIIGIIFYGSLGHAGQRDAYPHALDASMIYLIFLALAVAVLIQLFPGNRAGRNVKGEPDETPTPVRTSASRIE